MTDWRLLALANVLARSGSTTHTTAVCLCSTTSHKTHKPLSLLTQELGRRLKKTNPVVAEIFTLMSRDEARHAGFLNKVCVYVCVDCTHTLQHSMCVCVLCAEFCDYNADRGAKLRP